MEKHEEPARPYRDFATGIVLRFGYRSDSSVMVAYKRFDLFGGEWKEGHQERSLVLTFNTQCFVADVVMELKLAAEALGISFGEDPALTVVQPTEPPEGHNWMHLSESSAKRLGWKLVHPFGPIQEVPPFEIEGE